MPGLSCWSKQHKITPSSWAHFQKHRDQTYAQARVEHENFLCLTVSTTTVVRSRNINNTHTRHKITNKLKLHLRLRIRGATYVMQIHRVLKRLMMRVAPDCKAMLFINI